MSTTIYAVQDQHGMNRQIFFATEPEAQRYRDKCATPVPWPGKATDLGAWTPSYIVVPYRVWETIEERENEA